MPASQTVCDMFKEELDRGKAVGVGWFGEMKKVMVMA